MITTLNKCPETYILLFVLLFIFSPVLAEDNNHAPVLTFGIVPQQSPDKITRLWGPIMDWLGNRSGHKIKVVTAKSFSEFETNLANGTYDFAYMNPYQFIVFHESLGYQALARQKDKYLHGIIVTRTDSDYTSLKDLRGLELSFPPPYAFAASIITRGNMKEADIDYTPVYVSSHDSVYLTVAKGLYPAGGGVLRTLNNMPAKIRKQLRILWQSDGFMPHVVAVHPLIPEPTQRAVLEAMLNMAEDPEGMRLLKSISFEKGLIKAHNHDWDDVRALKAKELDFSTYSD